MTIENSNVCKFLSDDERKQYKSYKRTLFWKNFGFWGIIFLYIFGMMMFGLALNSYVALWVISLVWIGLSVLLGRDMKKLARFCAQMERTAEAREARKLGIS